MKLSIVTTLYHSASCLEEFCAEATAAAHVVTDDFEIILVDDGSPDGTMTTALRLHQADSRIKVIELSRNFGEHQARMTGLAHAKGEFIFLIQSDLETSPHSLSDFWQALAASPEADMIYGVQEDRDDHWQRRFRRSLFYKCFNLLSGTRFRPHEVACKLMTRRFVQALISHQERTVCFMGLCHLTGFIQKPCTVIKIRRRKSAYSIGKDVKLALDAITSFSARPLVMIFYLGSMLSLLSLGYIAVVLVEKIFFGFGISGWTSLIISIWLLGGLILASIGVVGIYLSRIFLEVKQRPYAIVKHIYEN